MKLRILAMLATVVGLVGACAPGAPAEDDAPFNVMEATIEDIHQAYRTGTLTARQLTQMYLDRIEAYDKNGPMINSVITINPKALEEADRVDAEFKRTGNLMGPLHGIVILVKDQIDVGGMPTTLGSLVMKDYVPTLDAGGVAKVKQAGAIILAKMTLGEGGGGDTYGSLFGATRNPYDLERTVGGSSGGPAAGISANFGTVAIGQEGFASIRRPSTWNSTVGMRPTPGLVTRSGVWAGYPSLTGQIGPMARTVTDLAKLLDVMVGYDPEDPTTALGVGKHPDTYTRFLDRDGLKGARIGILRESMVNLANTTPPSRTRRISRMSRRSSTKPLPTCRWRVRRSSIQSRFPTFRPRWPREPESPEQGTARRCISPAIRIRRSRRSRTWRRTPISAR